jgi:signal transduction histidine kinase
MGLLWGALAFGLNLFRIELFFQVDLLLGTTLVWVAMLWFGFRAGVLAAVLASVSTFFLWGHPWAVVIFSLEGLLVGAWVLQRRGLLFSANILYWIFCGAPLVWLFYKVVLGVTTDTAVLIMLKQSVNGVLNALLANLVFYFLPAGITSRARMGTNLLFQHALFLVMAALLVLPVIGGVSFFARQYRAAEENKLAATVHYWGDHDSVLVKKWAQANPREASRWGERFHAVLEEGHFREGVFQTLVDARGQVVFSCKPGVVAGEHFVRPPGGTERVVAQDVRHWIPALEPGTSVMKRWRNSFYVLEHAIVDSDGWRLVTEVSPLPLIESLTQKTVQALLWLVALLAFVYALSLLLSVHFLKTLKALEAKTREVPQRLEASDGFVLPESRFEELKSLIFNFSEMIVSLQNAFREQKKFAQKEHAHLKEKSLLVRDLHDGIGGIVTNIGMLGEYALTLKDSNARDDVVKKMVALAREGSVEVRSFMNSTTQGDASWSDLLAELKDYASALLEGHGIAVQCDSDIHPAAPLPGIYRYGNIARIAREAVTNVLKHSQATVLKISFVVSDLRFELVLHDNGVGFDSQTVRRRGVASMMVRAHDMNAQCTVTRELGTRVCLRMGFSDEVVL